MMGLIRASLVFIVFISSTLSYSQPTKENLKIRITSVELEGKNLIDSTSNKILNNDSELKYLVKTEDLTITCSLKFFKSRGIINSIKINYYENDKLTGWSFNEIYNKKEPEKHITGDIPLIDNIKLQSGKELKVVLSCKWK